MMDVYKYAASFKVRYVDKLYQQRMYKIEIKEGRIAITVGSGDVFARINSIGTPTLGSGITRPINKGDGTSQLWYVLVRIGVVRNREYVFRYKDCTDMQLRYLEIHQDGTVYNIDGFLNKKRVDGILLPTF
jgi:hypothetical protein